MNSNFHQSSTRKLVSLIISNKPVTASQLGWIVSELIKRERAPGGPYIIFNDAVKNTSINQDISAFITRQTQTHQANSLINSDYKKILQKRYAKARYYIESLPKALSQSLSASFERIKSADNDGEIGLLSTLFYDSYVQDSPKPDTVRLIEYLDIANILIWVSYSIYDEAIDDSSPKALQNIPAASALLRVALSLLDHDEHREIVSALLDEVDTAMTEELNRKSKQSKPLAILHKAMERKSAAHIAGPLIIAVYFSLGDKEEIRATLQQYCSARQLLDDLYDWQEDLAKDQFTYANVQLAKVKTAADKRIVKRRLMKEVLEMSTSATHALNVFTAVTTGRIATIAHQALIYDNATTEAIASYTAARQ